MAPEQHSAASLETHEERVERVNDMANALNLRRAKNIRDDNEGISGGTVEYNQPDTSLEKE
ncbi:MAG: hypothetical protein GWN00_18015, partial [Aliifodinibius sp.]|nr:hypothetical protein [Fodinibius sp.]NIV14412.1 hypothetical protein [Fodinibius sp.]NIY26630.1 hypothetical protein [Fodinibius sp.]